MKILVATYWTYPHKGGLSTYMDELTAGLSRAGHEVEILAHTPDLQGCYLVRSGKFIDESLLKKSIAARINAYCQANSIRLSDWTLGQEISRYAFELVCAYFGLDQYDLIHAQDVIAARAVSRMKSRRVPLITTLHGSYTLEFQYAGSIRSAEDLNYSWHQESWGARSSDKIIAPSHWLRRFLETQCKIPPHLIAVVRYGIDLERLWAKQQTPLEIPLSSDSFVFLCPARLTALKGHRYLLEALAIFRQETDRWQCWLVGEGELKDSLRQQCEQLGLANKVHFLGNRADMPALLHRADAVILPSYHENLPFAVIEGQAAQKPVIAADAGGIPEMIEHGKTGLIVPVKDSYHLYEQLKRIYEDANLRATLGLNAVNWAKKQWNIERMIEQTLTVYKQVWKHRHGGGTA